MLKRYSEITEFPPETDNEIFDRMLRFRFVKTPQLRHQFRCARGNQIFPRVKIDIFEAIPNGNVYLFRGFSATGVVPRPHFLQALNEGYVVLEAH